MPTKRKADSAEVIAARHLGRDEGAAWAVAALVNMYGTSTESLELAQAWGMRNILAAADPSDLPHLKKLIKDYPGKFGRYNAAKFKAALQSAQRSRRHGC